ncbi:phosphonate metabolism protein/1,5-bisphosphokinase (PRPP-forming) PhnN [uncultured Neptuniibacter sp.]|uniref:phosphonate metabolism protein/1,5-bisphosphokinase (PRPP-forming) PhnN n=1 Tax=uncultured Neptuniibacter sp. TaxID=502143 RepID=UPI0026233865|nr:phosphonate metabolism protein/1,5-bisphosphokinase (PRPP-forming) PhnN [uncultured Neptuniibacter sp.]
MAKLFYVIGASGVGKDSLLQYARETMSEKAPVVFTHRYITRPADAGGENHVALSRDEFERRHEQGCFAMSWQSHQNRYGIGIEIDQWLELGLNVVINGSRKYLPEAEKRYPNLIPVLISTSSTLLRERLTARGRETQPQIEARLAQAESLDKQLSHPDLIKIMNDGALSDAGDQLLAVIQEKELLVCA